MKSSKDAARTSSSASASTTTASSANESSHSTAHITNKLLSHRTLKVNRLFEARGLHNTLHPDLLGLCNIDAIDKFKVQGEAHSTSQEHAATTQGLFAKGCFFSKKLNGQAKDLALNTDRASSLQPLKKIFIHKGQDRIKHEDIYLIPAKTPEGSRSEGHHRKGSSDALLRYTESCCSDCDTGIEIHTTLTRHLPAQKRTSSASTVAEFFKKFSPKLSRSKKSLQWYTVDIQPSLLNAASADSDEAEKDDVAVDDLRSGVISSEFASEVSECLLSQHWTDSCPVVPVVAISDKAKSYSENMPLLSHTKDSLYLKDKVRANSSDSSNSSKSSAQQGDYALSASKISYRSIAHSSTPWRPMVVDIDIDRPNAAASPPLVTGGSQSLASRHQFFSTMNSHSDPPPSQPPSLAHKHVEFRLPEYSQVTGNFSAPLMDVNSRVPSYIKLSRALNGYSARNMYTSKKLVNSRDYNMLLCKSEEYLNRRSTPTPTPTPLLSFPHNSHPDVSPAVDEASGRSCPARRTDHSHSSNRDFRRAASEDRDLSLVGLGLGFQPVRDEAKELAGKNLVALAHCKTVPQGSLLQGKCKPGYEFLQKLDEEAAQLQELCMKGQQDLFGKELSEEASEQLRSAVGKTNLLLTQKFEQFRQLCNKNINETEADAFKTTLSDLEGFWEMMSIQICDVRRMFKEVDSLTHRVVPSSESSVNSTASLNGSQMLTSSFDNPTGTPLEAFSNAQRTRRGSKPKVTFQLNERDVHRKELIAAKRKAFEQQQKQEHSDNSPLPTRTDTGTRADSNLENRALLVDDHDIQIFMPAVQTAS